MKCFRKLFLNMGLAALCTLNATDQKPEITDPNSKNNLTGFNTFTPENLPHLSIVLNKLANTVFADETKAMIEKVLKLQFPAPEDAEEREKTRNNILSDERKMQFYAQQTVFSNFTRFKKVCRSWNEISKAIEPHRGNSLLSDGHNYVVTSFYEYAFTAGVSRCFAWMLSDIPQVLPRISSLETASNHLGQFLEKVPSAGFDNIKKLVLSIINIDHIAFLKNFKNLCDLNLMNEDLKNKAASGNMLLTHLPSNIKKLRLGGFDLLSQMQGTHLHARRLLLSDCDVDPKSLSPFSDVEKLGIFNVNFTAKGAFKNFPVLSKLILQGHISGHLKELFNPCENNSRILKELRFLDEEINFKQMDLRFVGNVLNLRFSSCKLSNLETLGAYIAQNHKALVLEELNVRYPKGEPQGTNLSIWCLKNIMPHLEFIHVEKNFITESVLKHIQENPEGFPKLKLM